MNLVLVLSKKLKRILINDSVLDVEVILDVECIKKKTLYERAFLNLGLIPFKCNVKPTVCQGVCQGLYCGLEKTKSLDGRLCPIGERPGYPLNPQKPSKNSRKIPRIPLLSLTYMPMFLEKRGNPWN